MRGEDAKCAKSTHPLLAFSGAIGLTRVERLGALELNPRLRRGFGRCLRGRRRAAAVFARGGSLMRSVRAGRVLCPAGAEERAVPVPRVALRPPGGGLRCSIACGDVARRSVIVPGRGTWAGHTVLRCHDPAPSIALGIQFSHDPKSDGIQSIAWRSPKSIRRTNVVRLTAKRPATQGTE